MIDQPKDFKIRNDEGKYLSFNFDARTGSMDPLWGPISMSYPFTQEEAYRLANLYEAEVMSPAEWQLQYEMVRR